MRLFQLQKWLAFYCHFTFTQGEVAIDALIAQITPAPDLIRREQGVESVTVPSSVCGYVTGDYSQSEKLQVFHNTNNSQESPIVCSSALSCSQYGGDPGQFACCDRTTCFNDYSQCIASHTTGSFTTCSVYNSQCLYWSASPTPL
jgi:hypothetical protein